MSDQINNTSDIVTIKIDSNGEIPDSAEGVVKEVVENLALDFYNMTLTGRIIKASAIIKKVNKVEKKFLTLDIILPGKYHTIETYNPRYAEVIWNHKGELRSFSDINFGKQSIKDLRLYFLTYDTVEKAEIKSLKIKRDGFNVIPVFSFIIPKDANSDSMWALSTLINESNIELKIEKMQQGLFKG